MRINAKAISNLVLLIGGFNVAAESSEPSPTKNLLRGNHQQKRALAPNKNNKDIKGDNGNGNGPYKKLEAGGCTVLEKANLCERAQGGPPVRCDDDIRSFACEETSTGQIYQIDNDMEDLARGKKPGVFDIDDDAKDDVLMSGLTMFVGDANVDTNTARISFVKGKFGRAKAHGRGGNPGKGNSSRRLITAGEKKVLALKVVSADGQKPDYSTAVLADSVFGSLVEGPDQVNLASQYTACSHGQLNFAPMDDEDSKIPTTVTNIVNGVAQVTVANLASAGDAALRNAAMDAINTAFGPRGGADYVMVCLPESSMGGIAYAYVNYWLSVYKNHWCTYTSVQLHEVGHNLGLAHSGETSTYDDQSGFMGYSYNQDDQKMCFNGPKNWQLGWFSDRHENMDPSTSSFNGKLYGTTKYGTTISSNKMILRLNDSSCPTCDVYISFNHDAMHNSATIDGQNKVLVHKKSGVPSAYAPSTLKAKLSAGGEYTATVNGVDVKIKVNSIDTSAGYADVTVGSPPALPPTPPPTQGVTPPPTQGVTPPPTQGVTPPPTQGVTPPPTHAVTQYKIVCGSTAGSCKNNKVMNAEQTEEHEVRCCSDTFESGWVKKSFCDVWGESDLPICYADRTFAQAEKDCSDAGARLCTEQELLGDCTRGSGCSYDHEHVWSSTPVPPCTDDASCDDEQECTVNTCGVDGICQAQPVPDCGKFVACGSTVTSGCGFPRAREASPSDLHEVRCCSKEFKPGWVKKSTCDVYGESDLPTCQASTTFAEAKSICSAWGAELCSRDEILADCTRGSGCGYDAHHVWTSTSTAPACSSNSDCISNDACTTGTCGASGACSFSQSESCTKTVVCGSTASCTSPPAEADPSALHEVRCCSKWPKTGWVKKSNCSVYGESDLSGCNADKTFAQAEEICSDHGARLCTREELAADCTRGSGCGYDADQIWSSDTWTAPAAGSWTTTTEPPLENGGGTTEFTATTSTIGVDWGAGEATTTTVPMGMEGLEDNE